VQCSDNKTPRLLKEVETYESEAEKEQRQLDHLAAEAQSEDSKYKVKQLVSARRSSLSFFQLTSRVPQQQQAHRETLRMIPDSQQRLAKAVAELKDLVVRLLFACTHISTYLTGPLSRRNSLSEATTTTSRKTTSRQRRLLP
jgi:predicted ester cyclase